MGEKNVLFFMSYYIYHTKEYSSFFGSTILFERWEKKKNVLDTTYYLLSSSIYITPLLYFRLLSCEWPRHATRHAFETHDVHSVCVKGRYNKTRLFLCQMSNNIARETKIRPVVSVHLQIADRHLFWYYFYVY